jgi:pyruvate,water dikinase
MSAQKKFAPPSPGSWQLDATHCVRPRSRWLSELFEERYTPGFREGFARYGALLDTIEYASINGFPYLAVRPLGAPKDAKGTPPKFLFSLLLRLVPALRRRRARAAEVLSEKTWRKDREEFFGSFVPKCEKTLRAFTEENVAALDDRALADHITRLRAAMGEMVQDHFARAPCAMLPVGDFIAHVTAWTGCSPNEALELLRGSSPESVSAVVDVDRVASALKNAPELRAEVEGGDNAAEILERLRTAAAPLGDIVSEWLARQGERLVGGHDLTDRRAIEVPATLIATLRARLAGSTTRAPADPSKLRARVAAEHHEEFDALLAEARSVYGLRDARMGIDWWGLGLVRRALMEAGARLARRSALEQPDHAIDLYAREVTDLLSG